MNRLKKTVLVVLMLTIIPMKQWAQQQQFIQSQPTVDFDITEIANFDERIFFLYHLSNDSRFDVIPSEQDGVFIVSASEAYENIDLEESFADFRTQNASQFSVMSKEQAAETACEYKATLPREFTLSLMMDVYVRSRQNNTCANADPFCTDNGLYEFPAGVNAGSGESGPYYDCLSTTPNPAWYYMRILNPGNIDIYMYSTPSVDIDFCCWGPFTDPTSPCPNGLTSNKVVSCSYAAAHTEHCLIPSSAQTGQYYILVITNYSNQTTNISFSKVAGTGTTDCGILPPMVENNGPYCVGQTIHLTANGQTGASYSWTGPGGFTSTQQNPTRPNCTMAMAGTYTCTISIGSQTNSATTEVVIYPMPSANFNFTTVCVGEATQFTNTSTTNPPGQQINSYVWNFGDGQTSTISNPMHTYASPGTYQVTLTVACGNGLCTNEITKSVTVNALPTVSFESTTVCQGESTEFTGHVTGGQNITNFQWNFGDGQTGTGQNTSHTYAQAGTYQVTLTATSANGSCPGEVTQTVTVIALPAADAGPDQTIPYGGTAQLSGTGGAGTYLFHWEPANMVTNPNAQSTQTVVLTQDQTYTLTVTNPQGNCVETDEVTIHINGSAMTVSANASPGSICEGESTQLEVSAGGGTGNFTFAWTPTTGLSNPNIYNPIATPAQTTTYSCTVGDGQTTQTVSVTVTVNYPEYEEEDHYICPGETFIWNGLTCSAEGDYDFHTTTAQGCEKTITLHLHHYPTFDETTITEYICYGDSYNFFGTNYNVSGQYSHTLQSVHGCDSIVRLNLTVWPENEIEMVDVSLCPEQLPYYYPEDPYQTPLYEGLHIFFLEDNHGCERDVWVEIEVNDYYMPPVQTEYVCYQDSPSYTWNMNGQTYHQDIFVQDTLPTEDCDGIFRLDLHFMQIPDVIEDDVITCDSYTWPMTGQTFTHSGTYYHSVSLDPFPCEQVYQLNLTINTQSILDDATISGECDVVPVSWFGQDTTFTVNTTYTFMGVTDEGCYREQTYHIESMKYTPNPNKIQCSDASAVVFGPPGADADTIAVVTNTEFFSFQYTFFVEEANRDCIWESCTWEISKPSWAIEFNPTPQVSSNGKSYGQCTVFVADRQNDYVVLTATISNGCGTKQRKFYLKSSFLGVDENSFPSSVTIMPNPNNGKMRIDFENMEGHTGVKVFDMTGNQIDAFETNVSSSHHSYDYNMKRYAEGIYFFVIANDNRVFTKKVVIIH